MMLSMYRVIPKNQEEGATLCAGPMKARLRQRISSCRQDRL